VKFCLTGENKEGQPWWGWDLLRMMLLKLPGVSQYNATGLELKHYYQLV
jgi:hypothetical protein